MKFDFKREQINSNSLGLKQLKFNIMKYPVNQFEVLLSILKQFAVHFDLTSIHACTLHYMVYQQLSDMQPQSHLYCVSGSLKKALKSLN